MNAGTGAPIGSPFQISFHEGTKRTRITNVRFSPEGSSIAAITDVGFGEVWSVRSGTELGAFTTVFGGGFGFADVAFSPDGRWLAASGSGVLLMRARCGPDIEHRRPPTKTSTTLRSRRTEADSLPRRLESDRPTVQGSWFETRRRVPWSAHRFRRDRQRSAILRSVPMAAPSRALGRTGPSLCGTLAPALSCAMRC